jgi:predicted glycoside hydrolase/deacetylase ChbG (UPF0249 family)
LSLGERIGSSVRKAEIPGTGLLIINADDWGRDRENTNRIAECVHHGSVSSVSAMVFMEDSERAASIAREGKTYAGLHLNLTMPFSAPPCSRELVKHQERVIAFLRSHAFARIVFHPGLARSFEYVVAAQLEEFARIYGDAPQRIDGHHHMHLCANVVFGRLLPPGTIVRRNFSFQPGEKSLGNRLYRRFIDGRLARRHCLTDSLFLLPPLETERLQPMFSLAATTNVEIETHPVHPDEYKFLTGQEVFRLAKGVRIGPPSMMLRHTESLRPA